MVVEEQFLGAIVVREVEIRPAILVKVSGRRRERPSRATDAELVGHVLEPATADVVEEEVLPAVVRELEAVVHDPRGREVPQINVTSEIRGDVQVEQAVAVVVEPDCTIAVHPAMQSGGLGDVLESLAVHAVSYTHLTLP